MLALFVVLFLAAAASADRDQVSKDVPRTLCGPKLADAHMLYCYSSERLRKRSVMLPGKLYMENEEEIWQLMVRSQQRALALASRAKRMPGLVDECCYKPCYVSELINYCET